MTLQAQTKKGIIFLKHRSQSTKDNYGIILCVFLASPFISKFRNLQYESLQFVIGYVVN
jgi:hypothetical protein